MLVSVGRGPLVEGIGLERIGVEFDRRNRHRHRRAAAHHRPAHLRRRRLRRLLAARPHRLPRGEVAAENACGHDATVGNRAVPRPIYTDPGDRQRRPDRGAGTRAVRRRRRDRDVPVDRERPGRDAERDGRLGEVDPRDARRRTSSAS